jgi:hypothetical protein
MKYAWTILIGLLTIVSCQSHQSKNIDETTNPDSLMAWYENVFTKAEVDTALTIPDYVFSTDWMQRYAQYIESHFEGRGDMWFEKVEDNPFDCKYWTLAYVDNDTIPEMLLYGGCNASGSIILTQYNGEVYSSPRGDFSYIKGGCGLLHSQFRYADDTWGEVYEMKDGQFIGKCDYFCNSTLIDTNDIADYGLSKEELSRYQIGNGNVEVCEIMLGGERIGTCYGYNQWPRCPAFGKVKQTLDSLYYTKGTSTFFPFPSESMAISTLINVVK